MRFIESFSTPGTLLGSVSGELGLRKYLESNGHRLVVTSSKEGADSVLDKELPDAQIVVSQPFWPAYMTAERFAKAKKLKMVVTAGIGSDHTELQSAMERNVTVAEVTYCNSNSVAEHILMMPAETVRHQVALLGPASSARSGAKGIEPHPPRAPARLLRLSVPRSRKPPAPRNQPVVV